MLLPGKNSTIMERKGKSDKKKINCAIVQNRAEEERE